MEVDCIMNDLERKYLEIDKQEENAKRKKENDEIDEHIRKISLLIPLILKRCQEFNWTHVWIPDGKEKHLAFSLDYTWGPPSDRDCFNFYLLADGRISLEYNEMRLLDMRNRDQRTNIDPIYYYRCFIALLKATGNIDIPKNIANELGITSKEDNQKKSQKKNTGCYIATAIYGSYEAPEVRVLRKFRDEVLQQSFLGRLFITTYYQLSPPVAERLKGAKRSNQFVKSLLDRWVERLRSKKGY